MPARAVRKFCAAFKPPSEQSQANAIGLSSNRRNLSDMDCYRATVPNSEALCRCLDPGRGDWENLDPPEPSEWLEQMLDRTPDQSFRDFVASRPNQPDALRRTIYLQPICEPMELECASFPAGPWPSWQALISAVQRFYAPLPVRALPPLPVEKLSPQPTSRRNYYGKQYHAGDILEALAKVLPQDAYCMLAVTMWDLYPREEWNFVYGLANLKRRTGVFSFVRHTPEESALTAEERAATMLHRSMKTMLHEVGHMFGMKHCTWYNCLMRGSNGESVEHQKNYLHLCPVCLRKLHWSIGFDMVERYGKLLELYQEYEASSDFFARDSEFLRGRLDALADLPPGATMISGVRRGGQTGGSRANEGAGRGGAVVRAGREIAAAAFASTAEAPAKPETGRIVSSTAARRSSSTASRRTVASVRTRADLSMGTGASSDPIQPSFRVTPAIRS